VAAGFSILLLLPCDVGAQGAARSGEQTYKQYCASCHDQTSPRIPSREALRKLPATRILRTLDFGVMMSVAYPLQRDERQAVAAFLGTSAPEATPSSRAFCPGDRPIMAADARHTWNGWSAASSNTRFQDSGGIAAADLTRLKLKWAFGFDGDITAFAAPTIVNGTMFVGSAGGLIHAIDAATGCLHWTYRANGPVRAAPLALQDGPRRNLVFGDQLGWVYALDARTGKEIWKTRVDDHEATRLTATAAAYGDLVFVPAASWEETRAIDPQYPCCTFRGSVTALRVRDGSRAWQTYMVDPPERTGATKSGTATFGPSGAGIWSTPTIDPNRGVMYVTTGDNYSHPATATSDAIVALNLKTGRIAWSQQTTPADVYNSSCGNRGPNCPEDSGPDHDYGAAAMLIGTSAGRDVLVAGQKSGVVYALDPDRKGEILWQARVGKGGTNGGVQWGMTTDGRNFYASVSDMVRLPSGPDTPPLGDARFDATQGGGLTALRLDNGERVWHAAPQPCAPPRPGCSPAQPGALTSIPGVVFSGSLDGHLRAFSTENGRVLWDVDTAVTYTTVNGVEAKGGSLDGAGPVVVGGMVYVNSGYPRFGGMPGNVLLAFGID
jgi:polyvinyl alcohol dehydrogenase (cytochrome)